MSTHPSARRSRHLAASAGLALVTLLAATALEARADGPIAAEVVATGLANPLFATAPEGDGRLFIVERDGRIRILVGGTVLATPFLDIHTLVSRNSERGLLGLAFPPDYADTGLFYTYYTDLSGDSVIARFQTSEDPDRADPASQEILLVVAQPFPNHNGGTIAFGPDRDLYFALGDGGSLNDPAERAQDPTTLLGKMLRFDITGGAGSALGIPGDNPFVEDSAVRNEIWAFGLRNPYRFSFDRETGDLWIADVGQSQREEVDFEPAGGAGGRNWGWDVMEGSLCNPNDPAPAPPCNDASLSLPVHEYGHVLGLCSITGGFAYRGPIPYLQGLYFFGDFCRGAIWSFDRAINTVRGRVAELLPASTRRFQLVGFGESADGGLYLVHYNGTLYRIRAPEPACSDGFDNDGDGLADAADPACADPLQDGELPRDDLRIDVRGFLDTESDEPVTVAVFGSERVDLDRADPATLAFGPSLAPSLDGEPAVDDLDGDGHWDWTLRFDLQASGLPDGDSVACVHLEIARVPFQGCTGVSIPSGSGSGSGSGSDGWEAEADEGEATPAADGATATGEPTVVQYVEPTAGCTAWRDCGWVWASKPPLPADADGGEPFFELADASLPALGIGAGWAAGLALLAIGYARLRR